MSLVPPNRVPGGAQVEVSDQRETEEPPIRFRRCAFLSQRTEKIFFS